MATLATNTWVQGDLEPDMAITLTTAAALAALPAALAVNLAWKRPDGTTATVPLVVVDAPTGQLKRVWSAGDTSVVGLHRGRVVITCSNGEPLSEPDDYTHLYWWVFAP